MIDATEAVAKACEYFAAIYKNTPMSEVLLEEVELRDNLWDITFGFDYQPSSGSRGLGPGERMYKRLTLDAAKGVMVSMKSARIDS